jgi:hypothetical protein
MLIVGYAECCKKLIVLSVVKLSFIMLNVVKLSVIAPYWQNLSQNHWKYADNGKNYAIKFSNIDTCRFKAAIKPTRRAKLVRLNKAKNILI